MGIVGATTWIRALRSRRTLSVALLSFSSGLPLGLVWIAIPDWMRDAGVDIRIVGLTTLAQAPWSLKLLWAPLMDRFPPPFGDRRRGFIAIGQIALFFTTLILAGLGDDPATPWVMLALTAAIGFSAASQDIAIDAYAVEVLRPEERGWAVGFRTGLYRAAMYVSGALAISAAAVYSWSVVAVALALLYLPCLAITRWAPSGPAEIPRPQTIREALWKPFLGFAAKPRSIEILAFVVLYKLGDNLSQALTRPFLNDAGYGAHDRGIAVGTINIVASVGGAFIGGAATSAIGISRALWIFGVLQIVSNLGYVLVANIPPQRLVMYGAVGFETVCTGVGMGAFGVLLLQLTEKRFSATQYALLSSLFALPRIFAGPVSGFAVHAIGWSNFFWATMLAGIPGLVLLARFAPWGHDDFDDAAKVERWPRLSRRGIVLRGIGWGVLVAAILAAGFVSLDWLEARRGGEAVAAGAALRDLLVPGNALGSLRLFGILVFAGFCGLFAAAVYTARSDPEGNG